MVRKNKPRRWFLRLSAASGLTGLAGCFGARSANDGTTETTDTANRATTTKTTGGTRTTPATTEAAGETIVSGPMHGDDLPPDSRPTDGYPPRFERKPTNHSVDAGSFERIRVDGTAVPLVPIDVAYYWYARREARFADARGRGQYDSGHVYGAVLSTAPDGLAENDPVEAWSKSDRIVCYCGCPHHLSSMRAAALLDDGYENVFVIDEGFWEWHDRNYPMAGSQVEERRSSISIVGQTRSRFAGRDAWAFHDATDQREATRIDADGRYRLDLHFSDVTPDSIIRVKTPAYSLEKPLGDLLRGSIAVDGRLTR